jgi:hypothetical protein
VKTSYLIMAVANVALLALTATLGMTVSGMDGYMRHFLLGVLAAFFACFVHVVAYMYFVVQEKIVQQAVLHDGLDAAHHNAALGIKSRALWISMAGIVSVLATVFCGAMIGIVATSTPHLLVAFGAVGANVVVSWYQDALISDYGRLFDRAFAEPSRGAS